MTEKVDQLSHLILSRAGNKKTPKKYFSFSQQLVDSSNLRIHLAATNLFDYSHPLKPLRS